MNHISQEEIQRLQELLVGKILGHEALTQFQSGDIAKKHLLPHAAKIKELSLFYNSKQRDSFKTFPEKDAEAYALYFLPVNYIKVRELINRSGISFGENPVEILDYGCGPGTASLALNASFNNCRISAMDNSAGMLSVAAKLCSDTKITFYRSDKDLFNRKYNLIAACNVLNELKTDEKEKLLTKFYNSLAPEGVIFIIEPALQGITRELMAIRDLMLGGGPGFEPSLSLHAAG